MDGTVHGSSARVRRSSLPLTSVLKERAAQNPSRNRATMVPSTQTRVFQSTWGTAGSEKTRRMFSVPTQVVRKLGSSTFEKL